MSDGEGGSGSISSGDPELGNFGLDGDTDADADFYGVDSDDSEDGFGQSEGKVLGLDSQDGNNPAGGSGAFAPVTDYIKMIESDEELE